MKYIWEPQDLEEGLTVYNDIGRVYNIRKDEMGSLYLDGFTEQKYVKLPNMTIKEMCSFLSKGWKPFINICDCCHY